jgi:hypothetical protein
LYAQDKVEAAKPAEDESATEVKSTVHKPQKVDEMRKVVVGGTTQENKKTETQKVETKETVKYDEKGGIIVPNKSKGIRQTSLSPSQEKKLDQIKKAQARRKSTSSKRKKD